jgi:hypothetical protein
MSTVRLSLSLPSNAHPNLEVTVEQPGRPAVVVDVPLAASEEDVKEKPTEVAPVRSICPHSRAPSAEQENYELGGYAGI